MCRIENRQPTIETTSQFTVTIEGSHGSAPDQLLAEWEISAAAISWAKHCGWISCSFWLGLLNAKATVAILLLLFPHVSCHLAVWISPPRLSKTLTFSSATSKAFRMDSPAAEATSSFARTSKTPYSWYIYIHNYIYNYIYIYMCSIYIIAHVYNII